jgi:2',3'-cyclic-nucleotide 2'-phosphodiesterase (5'-nucleotidase family)
MKQRTLQFQIAALCLGGLAASTPLAQAQIIVTEVNSNSNGGDFFELYNTGASPVDLTNWKWDDDSLSTSAGATFGAVTIPAGGVLVVFTGTAANVPAFKAAWGLGNDVEVYSANKDIGLGGSDAVILFNDLNAVVTSFNYKTGSTAFTTNSITVQPFARPGGAAPLGGHAGPSAGGLLGDGASAVWDGVSTASPAYVAASVSAPSLTGPLQARVQGNSLTSIGSPGTVGVLPVNVIPPTPVAITPDITTVPAGELRMRQISSIPLFGSEISAYDAASKRMFVNSNFGLQIVDASNPALPQLLSIVDFTIPAIGLNSNDVTSVDVFNGKVAVAVPNATKQNPGHVVFLNAADGSFISKVQVGVLPDNLTFTPDGTKVLTADEGEMLTGGTDPAPGSVTIIDVTDINTPVANIVGFGAFDATKATLKTNGVRIFEAIPSGLKDPSIDFEPEYVAVSPDGTKAMVTLQEANAVALLDIATATFTSIVPLGEKDYSTLLADFSDRDGPANTTLINLATGRPVFGMYMPDAIASFVGANGQTFYVIANEGDDRNDFLTETTTVSDTNYVLDPTVFPTATATALKLSPSLGRLVVSNAPGLRGDTDGDGDIDRILSYGGRSISILNSAGAVVWDSGDILDQKVAALGTPFFDDGRSDNKSIEPEGVTIGEIDGRTYAFIALERARSVAAFDVTNPAAPTYAGLATNATDANPEGVTFISKAESPNGQPMIAVTNETSNTLTFYSVAPYTMQLLHLADAEAGLLASQTAPNLAALVDAFDGTYPNTLILAGGDNYIPGPFAAAGTDAAVAATHTRGNNPFAADIEIHNRIGVEASTVGNHEFDFGTNAFSDAINDTNFPYLSSNLDFSGDSGISARYQETVGTGGLEEAASVTKKVVPSCVVTKGGQKIGLVGVTTQIIEGISSTGGVEVKGFAGDGLETNNMALLASQVQPVINDLLSQGVNKIVLMAHLQQITFEQQLAPLLTGVDIVLAAGSNTRLGDSNDVAVAFTGHAADFAGNYPIYTAGADGFPTVIVNTDNEFTYLGRLVADFDANGVLIVPNLTANIAVNGAYAATTANAAAAWGVAEVDLLTSAAFAPGSKGARVKQITDAVQGVITVKDSDIHGYTDVYLEGERAFVRREETNLGDITADANIGALRSIIGGTAPIVSLKNGGGIRAAIGSVAVGSGEKLPPLANPAVGKPAGGVSQLDIENSLRFNNRLIAFDTTPTGLKNILEHGVALWPNEGRFPQIGGVAFAWNSSLAANSRILTISLIGEDGLPSAAIYHNGAVVSNAPVTIKVVTLNFLANNGDLYPMKANGENFRYLLADNTLGPALDEGTNFTVAPQLPGNAVGEQAVLAAFFSSKHPTDVTAYNIADTAAALDLRIQRTAVRSDTVLPYTANQVITLNAFSPGMLAIGRSPSLMLTQPDLASAVGATRTAGQVDVTSNPSAFSLYTASSIQDLRGTGNMLVQAQGANVTLTLPIQKSTTLGGWETFDDLEVTFPKIENKEFYRLILPQ